MNLGEIGIKYKKIKTDTNTYILVPIGGIDGYSVGDIFYGTEIYKIPLNKKTIEEDEIFVDSVTEVKDLLSIYQCDDIDFVKAFYAESENDNIILVKTQEASLIKRKININRLLKPSETKLLQRVNDELSVVLNDVALDKILSLEDINLMKKSLIELKSELNGFRIREKNDLVTKVFVEDTHVKEIVTKNDVKKNIDELLALTKKPVLDTSSVSLKGLEQYIKERVFGHDEEIRMIAKTLMMNYTAVGSEKREEILLVGPTGVGKTETIRAAANYLNLPNVEVNSINLVPQGIRGISLEDNLFSLIVASGFDMNLAQNALIFFDEFDKLGANHADYKTAVKDIMLKFVEGSIFPIEKNDKFYNFNTTYLSKIYAGRFEEVLENNNTMGFVTQEQKIDIKSVLANKQYFGKELITRIKHTYLYEDLASETKKRILLESKLSEYLQKKNRYQRQFTVDLIATDSYIEALLGKLGRENKSIRELNNLVADTLEEAEYELLSGDYRGRQLVLTGDIVEDNKKFNL